jgi:hypothetical protein
MKDVTGIFHFDETGMFIRFETYDCYYSEKGGKFVKKDFQQLLTVMQRIMDFNCRIE